MHTRHSLAAPALAAARTPGPTVAPFQGNALPIQIFLLEPDSGTLCRILALYAARGLGIAAMQFEAAAPRTMKLVVQAQGAPEQLRVLVEKAAGFPGVIEAARM